MTSANVSDEPICRGNEEALRRLDGIADAITEEFTAILGGGRFASLCTDLAALDEELRGSERALRIP